MPRWEQIETRFHAWLEGFLGCQKKKKKPEIMLVEKKWMKTVIQEAIFQN